MSSKDAVQIVAQGTIGQIQFCLFVLVVHKYVDITILTSTRQH